MGNIETRRGVSQGETVGSGHRPGHCVLQWHITERCNLRCSHCYQGAEPCGEVSFQALLNILGDYKRFLDCLEAERGAPLRAHINVTGGEPLVRRDCLDFLRALSVEKPRITFGVLTNGTFISPVVARQLGQLGPTSVQVSIEGSEATHDRIRGAGNFRQVRQAVRNLVAESIPVAVSFTAHRGNYCEFSEVAHVGRKLHVARVWSDRMIPAGRGSSLEPLTPAETRQFFGFISRARDEAKSAWFGRTEISMVRGLQFLAGGRPYQCKAGDTLLTVMPDGDLYPCRRMPIHIGNVLTTPFAKLYFDSEILRDLRDRTRVSEGCEQCRFERLCRGGLRCLSYAVHGSPFRADPGCWLASQKRPAPADGASVTGSIPAV